MNYIFPKHKITFKAYVPENCGFIDEGWNTETIYITEYIPISLTTRIVNHHVKQTEISKVKDIKMIKIDIAIKVGIWTNIYNKEEIKEVLGI